MKRRTHPDALTGFVFLLCILLGAIVWTALILAVGIYFSG